MRTMNFREVLRSAALAAVVVLCLIVPAAAQTGETGKDTLKQAAAKPVPRHVASSAAYAEILLDRTERTAELEALLADYTEEFPKIKELRRSLVLIELEVERLAKIKVSDAGKLTAALGKLIVRKVELELEVWKMSEAFRDEHPDVKRAKSRVNTYESAIAEILG